MLVHRLNIKRDKTQTSPFLSSKASSQKGARKKEKKKGHGRELRGGGGAR